jgi:hypothetical protein
LFERSRGREEFLKFIFSLCPRATFFVEKAPHRLSIGEVAPEDASCGWHGRGVPVIFLV